MLPRSTPMPWAVWGVQSFQSPNATNLIIVLDCICFILCCASVHLALDSCCENCFRRERERRSGIKPQANWRRWNAVEYSLRGAAWHAAHRMVAYVCRLNLRQNVHVASRNLLFPHTRVFVTLIKASYSTVFLFPFLIFIKYVPLLLQVWCFQVHVIIIHIGTEFVPSFAASEKSLSANVCQRHRHMSSRVLSLTWETDSQSM